MSQENEMRRVLRQRLEQHGWSSDYGEISGQRWRSQESWEISSLWSPRGLRAWIVLEWQYDYVLGTTTPSLGFAAHRAAEDQPWAFAFHTDLQASFERRGRGRKRAAQPWRSRLQLFLTRLDAWRNEHNLGSIPAADLSESDVELWRDPAKWLAPLRPCLSERKWRLFACACLRRLPEVQQDEECLHVVAVAEQYADGLVRKRELRKARRGSPLSWLPSFEAYDEAVAALERAVRIMPPAEWCRLGALLRDLEPSPIAMHPSWLRRNGGLVASMAQIIYDRHSFADLPILADALEDAGCTCAAILDHCRRTPPADHARGCWALDSLTGRR